MNVDWLLNCDPREAQLEALRRSHLGYATRDSIDGEEFLRPIPGHRRDQPAKGWGHLLEMRVGKTPTHLNEGALFRRDYDFKWHVVLSPNAFKEDWALEAEKFGYNAPAIAFDSKDRAATQRFIDKNKRVGGLIAVNYEALRYEPSLAILGDIIDDRCLFGADESINMANPSSIYTKAALELAVNAGARRILTGKPTTQGPHDLWAQLRFIGQQNGIVHSVFKATYAKTGGFQGKQVTGIKNEELLHSILERCTFNARKKDWLKTPGRDYFERRLQLLPEQQALYDRMQKEFVIELQNGTIVSADQIITKLIKMQQISSGFIIDEERKVHEIVPEAKNPKINLIKEMLETEIEHKVVLVCHYQHTIDMLERALAKYNPAIIRGKQWHRSEDRTLVDEKSRFNRDRNCRVLIGQEQALRYGHTLMGDHDNPCYHEVFVENSYSLNDRSQCEERSQGAGQLFPVNIIDLIATPQDLAPIRALQRKEDIAAAVLQYSRDEGILPRPAAA